MKTNEEKKTLSNSGKRNRSAHPSKRVQERERRRKKELRNRFIAIGGVALFLIVILILIFYPSIKSRRDSAKIVASTKTAPANAVANTAGDPDAPVKVIAYSDYNCSHCKDFNDGLEVELIENYVNTGKVCYEFRSFAFMASTSPIAAQAAYCAMDQNKFWEYKETLYLNVGEITNPYSNVHLEDYARKLDLDMSEFRTCLSDGKYTQRIQDDLEQGRTDGVTGTPSFIVNGSVSTQSTLLSDIDKALTGE